ncbi:MAG: hypothetical protein RMX65_030685 [Nostoc sp. DedQUE01]
MIPTRGNPFIALIPEFDIQGMEQKQHPLDESSADNSIGVDVDWYEEIQLWVQQLGRKPSSQEIKLKWQELTGQELNAKGVTLLLENLGFPDSDN